MPSTAKQSKITQTKNKTCRKLRVFGYILKVRLHSICNYLLSFFNLPLFIYFPLTNASPQLWDVGAHSHPFFLASQKLVCAQRRGETKQSPWTDVLCVPKESHLDKYVMDCHGASLASLLPCKD